MANIWMYKEVRVLGQSQASNGIGKDFLHGVWKLYMLFLLLAPQKQTPEGVQKTPCDLCADACC